MGLGKTIEAGLVVAQLPAEGASRILIIVPRPLLGQWQDELYTLFGIVAHEAADQRCDVSAGGVFLVGREYAGSVKGSERLVASPPFDLCVIDEAHKVFAGIYRRFDSYGVYDEGSRDAQTAHRVRKLIGPAPVLMLTATPPPELSGRTVGSAALHPSRQGHCSGLSPRSKHCSARKRTVVDSFLSRAQN